MKVVALASLALAGCATQSLPVLTPEYAQQLTTAELCRGTLYFRPGNAETARAEVQRRGIDCAPLYPAIIAAEQTAPVIAPAPAITPMANPYWNSLFTPEVRCTSTRYGNTVQTSCR